MTLTLPLPANRANARWHWRVELRKKKAYWNRLNLMLAAGQLPKPPAEPMDPARCTVAWYVWSTMDQGNAMARLKWVEDWLTAHGYIADDDPEHLRYDWPPEQTIDRKDQRLEITLRLDTEEAA